MNKVITNSAMKDPVILDREEMLKVFRDLQVKANKRIIRSCFSKEEVKEMFNINTTKGDSAFYAFLKRSKIKRVTRPVKRSGQYTYTSVKAQWELENEGERFPYN